MPQRELEPLLTVLFGKRFISQQPFFSTHDHRSEFEALEASPGSTDPTVSEEDRCARAETHSNRNDRHQGRGRKQEGRRPDDVEEAFHDLAAEDTSEKLEINKRHTVEVFALLTKWHLNTP